MAAVAMNPTSLTGRIEDLIRRDYTSAALYGEQLRRHESRVRREMLHDNFQQLIEEEIASVFALPSVRDQMLKHARGAINLFAAVIDKISLVYAYGATRKIGDGEGEQNRLYRELQRECRLDARLATANRYCNALNEVLLRPVYRKSAGRMCLDVITPDMVTVIPDDEDPTQIQALLVYQLRPDAAPPKANVTVWTASQVREYQADWGTASLTFLLAPGSKRQSELEPSTLSQHLQLQLVSAGPNRYGRIPFVVVHAAEPVDTVFDTTRGNDLVEGTVTINLQAAQLRRIGKDQAERIIAYNGSSDDLPKEQPLDALTILAATSGGGTFTTLDMQADPEVLLKQMRATMATVSARYGVPDVVLWLAMDKMMGADMEQIRRPLMDVRARQIREVWEPAERELFDLMALVSRMDHPTLKIDPGVGEEFSVRFSRAPLALSRKERIDLYQSEIDMGLMSHVDALQEEDPSLTREEALDEAKRITDDEIDWMDMRRATNMGAGQGMSAQTPEENGAMGPMVRDAQPPDAPEQIGEVEG